MAEKRDFMAKYGASVLAWAETVADLAERSEEVAVLTAEAVRHATPGTGQETLRRAAAMYDERARTARQDALDAGELAAALRAIAAES